ncbi:MAG: cysteine desulfurase [Candidatus Pacebacteria bacterium]|nr:cysteine desulfurase [Candidatus Paceibacterota bacterium]
MEKSKKQLNKKGVSVYLDNASSTSLDSKVSSVIEKALKKSFANPSGIHELGLSVKNSLEEARGLVASVLSAHKEEIIFTSSGTESNNLAILGFLRNFNKPHLIVSNIEHSSILEICKYLESTKQAEVTYLRVEPNGIIDPRKIQKELRKNTVLISIMYANNEIGTIQPIQEIAKALRHFRKHNSQDIVFHTDATQAVNYLSLNVEKLGVDMMTFNGSKIYGPKGVGVLFKKRNIKLSGILHGGEQENGLRPGTENVPNILGLAEALSIAYKLKDKESKRLTILRDYFFKKISSSKILESRKIVFNGDLVERLPNNVNITIPKIPSDLLVIELGQRGVYVSAKSACKAGDGKASYVIGALNSNISELDGSIRFSLGRETKKSDIDYTVRSLESIILKLNKWYN